MTEARRREIERERQARDFAQTLVRELTREQQKQQAALAAQEAWRRLSPEQRKEHELQADRARWRREEERDAEKARARQSHGGSLDSMQVIRTVAIYKSFLYGTLLVALYSYIDMYKWFRHGGNGRFPNLPLWAAPAICLFACGQCI